MNYFKVVMIVKVKMCIKGKVFGKICVKNYQRFLFSKYVICNQERNGVRHEGKSWCPFLKKTSNALTGIYVFQKFAFYLKYILKDSGVYLLKFVSLVYTFDCNVSWIYKHKG